MTAIEDVMAATRTRGVVFEEHGFGEGIRTVDGLFTMPGGKAAWFLDSEGNTFELSEVIR